MWLPIDTTVLVDASGQGVSDHAAASFRLLQRLLGVAAFILAIDPKKKLLHEYEQRINAVMYAHQWLEKLNREQRVRVVDKVRLPRGARVKLLEARLHQEDFHLVEAALGSCGTIVTRDFRSFQNPVQTILRRELRIRVLSAAEMLSSLESQTENGP